MNIAVESGATPENIKRKRQIRNYLLDRRFQLRWAFRVVVATTLITAVMGFFLYRTVGDATDQMLSQKLSDPVLTEKAVNEFIKQAEDDKLWTLAVLITCLVSLVLVIGGVTVVYTHKIAGPIFKISKLLVSVDSSNLQLFAKLRRDDELKQILADIDNMLRRIRQQRRSDVEVFEAIKDEYVVKGGDGEKLKSFSVIIENYKKSVEM